MTVAPLALRRAAAVSFIALALAACSSEPESTADASAPADATVIDVSAFEFGYRLSSTDIPAGAVSFELSNDGTMAHDLVLEGGPGGGTDVINAGETATLNVTLEAGTYTLFCSVGNHRAQGMEVEITVS